MLKGKIAKAFALNFILIMLLSQASFAQESDISDDEFDDSMEFDKRHGSSFNGYPEMVFYEKEEFQEDRFMGLSKDQMIFEKVFEFLGDVDESEVMPYCNDPEKIADIILSKVREKIGDVSNVCQKIAEDEGNCKEEVKFHCSRFRQQDIEDSIDETDRLEILANSCPADEEAIVNLCILRSKEYMEQNLEFAEENCEFQWEDYGHEQQKNCELQLRDTVCEEDEYIEDCLVRWGAYQCPEISYPEEGCSGYWDQKYDDKGCIISYFCVGSIAEKKSCPEAKVPECGSNAYADDFYDENGCLYYRCVGAEAACPQVNIGQCNSGESLELRYDSRNCVIGYECIRHAVCGDGICNIDSENEASCPQDCGKQCPFTDEEANRMANECLNQNGAPEKVYDGSCIADVKCTIEASGNGITGNVVGITGRQVLQDNDDFVNQCRKEWEHQKANCEQLPNDCSKEGFIDSCVQREKKNYERELSKIDRRCKIDSRQQIRFMQRECSKSEKEVDRCIEENSRRCEQMEGISEQCSGKLTEENFRAFIVKEAKKRCRYADIFLREEIYSGSKPQKVIEKILSLKEAGVPGEFKGILDEEAEGLLGVSEDLRVLGEKEEEKGFAYKLKLFLGFAKEIEDGEIERLQLSKERLETSIASLSRLAEQVPDEVAAEILKEQAAELERQKRDIDSLIEQKQKKANGLLRLFGLLS